MLKDERDDADDRLSSGESPFRSPSALKCGAMIVTVKLALRVCGYRRVIKWIGDRVKHLPATTWIRIEVLKSAERTVAIAGALYPGRALCLEQSLVLYYLLRRQGVDVKYQQGVQPHPFQAHAWVEYQGEPLNDVEEHAQRFTRFPAVLP